MDKIALIVILDLFLQDHNVFLMRALLELEDVVYVRIDQFALNA
jgi:hypothetical protein